MTEPRPIKLSDIAHEAWNAFSTTKACHTLILRLESGATIDTDGPDGQNLLVAIRAAFMESEYAEGVKKSFADTGANENEISIGGYTAHLPEGGSWQVTSKPSTISTNLEKTNEEDKHDKLADAFRSAATLALLINACREDFAANKNEGRLVNWMTAKQLIKENRAQAHYVAQMLFLGLARSPY
ncbi:MAG: hypothetical protein DHS20C02_14470 [Micavibrio sp.]|nr:MAG: hypothetical protein DHS20C02_14470 [Micavibrio sp.]